MTGDGRIISLEELERLLTEVARRINSAADTFAAGERRLGAFQTLEALGVLTMNLREFKRASPILAQLMSDLAGLKDGHVSDLLQPDRKPEWGNRPPALPMTAALRGYAVGTVEKLAEMAGLPKVEARKRVAKLMQRYDIPQISNANGTAPSPETLRRWAAEAMKADHPSEPFYRQFAAMPFAAMTDDSSLIADDLLTRFAAVVSSFGSLRNKA